MQPHHSGAAGSAVEEGRHESRKPCQEFSKISPLLLKWFVWYARRYVRKHFYSIRVSKAGMPPDATGLPLVVYANHTSWWDPLVFLVLKDEFYRERSAFAPMDDRMLNRYQFFKRLGFFGVEQGTTRGARSFLNKSQVILQSPANLLAITPQGRFADARERPVRFAPGLGCLAANADKVLFVPLAAEFVFWEERLPEILVRFGKPTLIERNSTNSSDNRFWTAHFENALAQTQDSLAEESQKRQVEDFRTLLRGGAGQGGVYDAWRALKAWLRGEDFRKEHGEK
jgi:1-acyl-sn-glycerol-3-phosphate acyltransferase